MTSLGITILGLPLHPLIVHLVVVALPVGALGLIAAIVSPGVRARYGTLATVTLTVGALGTLAALWSGGILAESETLPERHASLGTATVIISLATTALAWVWWWLERRRDRAEAGTSGVGAMITGGLVAAGALATTVAVVLTGHSGSEAVWGAERHAPAPATSPAASGRHTLAEVAQHGTDASCWAAVDGGVYDLTEWIGNHPGGPQRILNLCGKDATEQFRGQHADAVRPNGALARHRIGELVA